MKVSRHSVSDPQAQVDPCAPIDWDVELDGYVIRLERAHSAQSSSHDEVDIMEYIPARDHPRFDEIARELIRVDIELSANCGMIRGQDYYRQRLGSLVDQTCIRNEIALEQRRHVIMSATPTVAAFSENDFPAIGQNICGFELKAELGRGSFGIVYLAIEKGLSDRQVVLKISAQFPGEAQLLAKLVHKNIVPIYSLHRMDRLHVVCMPLLGTTTLQDLLKQLESRELAPTSGIALVETIRECSSQTMEHGLSGQSSNLATQIVEPMEDRPINDSLLTCLRKKFQRQSYANSIVWFVSQLAEGISHAHDRSILHRDIKPANILISDDGVPMLLDFNLASDRSESSKSNLVFGGTPRYMAPEQIEEVLTGKQDSDGRADIYSLGILLFELLTLQPPFPDRVGQSNPQLTSMIHDRRVAPVILRSSVNGITSGIASIVRKSLQFERQDRYQTIQELLEDLNCELNHHPLEHASGESYRDRIRKWNLRHPRLSSTSLMASLAGLVLLVASIAIFAQNNRINRLRTLSWLTQAQQAGSTAQGLLTTGEKPYQQIQYLIEHCDQAISAYGALSRSQLTRREALQAEELVAQLYFLRARGHASMAVLHFDANLGKASLEAATRDAMKSIEYSQKQAQAARILLEAIQPPRMVPVDGPSRIGLRKAINSSGVPVRTLLDAMRNSITTDASNVWYWTNLAQLQLEAGEIDSAESSLLVACQIDPQLPWPKLMLGTIHLDHNKNEEAHELFDQVIRKEPQTIDAYLNRAIASIGMRDYHAALQDLNAIEAHASQIPRILFVRELVHRRMGNLADAEKDRDTALALEPRDARSWNARGEALLGLKPPDPEGALESFRQASIILPSLRNSYENIAHVLSEYLDRPSEAVEALNRAIASDPKYALAWSSRSVLNARLGNVENALSDAQYALELERTPIVCYHAASTYAIIRRNADDERQALQLLKATVRQNPALATLMQQDKDLSNLEDRSALSEIINAAMKLN